MNDFENKIAEKYDLDLDATFAFMEHLELVEVNKNAHIIEKGGFNDNFYIIRKGILRAYTPLDEDEQTLWFGYPGQAIVDVWCYDNGSLSPISIEAVIPCELYFISKTELEMLCAKSLPICNLVRKIFIGHATESEESFTSLFECEHGMERYLSILKRHPELLQNVPLKKLASYIHLAPQSLSRIRSQIK
jgi:hypothetical protein